LGEQRFRLLVENITSDELNNMGVEKKS